MITDREEYERIKWEKTSNRIFSRSPSLHTASASTRRDERHARNRTNTLYSEDFDDKVTQRVEPTDPYAKYYGMSSEQLQTAVERLENEGAIFTTRAATDEEIAIEAHRIDTAYENAQRDLHDAEAMRQAGSRLEYYTPEYIAGLSANLDAITAEREAFYSGLQTTGGWNITEVTGNKYQNEIDWLTGYIPSADKVLEYSEQYLPYTSAPDYAEKSMYVSTANGQEQYSHVSNMYTNTGFDDVTYDYINGNGTARDVLMLNSISDNTAFLGLDKSFLKEMTENEVSLFNYIYATVSADAAYEYIDFISSDLTARQRINESTRWAKYVEEHPHIADMTSIMMSPIKGLSYLGQIADYAADGTIDQNAGYNKFSYIPSVIREERGEQVNKSWGKLGDVGEFGYNLAMGMGDFAVNTIVSGGYTPIATLLMGGGAAADTTLAAKDRGLSDDQAIILGTVAGAVEAATEKFSIEALLDPDLAVDGFLKYVWKNMVTEGTEEGASNLLNSFADILISGDQSQWSQKVEYYKSQGYSDAAARERALGDQARSLGLDVLGGMLTGGLLAGGYGGVNVAFNTDGAPKKPRRKNVVVSLANVQVPSYETLTAKPNVPVVDIRKTASGSYAEQRKAFKVSQAAVNLYKAPITNRDTGADLFVTPHTFTHTFSNRSNQQENINMAEHMREVIENAVFTHAEPSRKADRDHTTGVYTFFSAVQTEQGVQPVKLKVKEYRLEGQDIPQTVKNFLQRMLNPETYASVYDGNVLVIETIEKEEANSSVLATVENNSTMDKHLLAPSEISVKELLSLVKGDAGKYVPVSKTQQVQELAAVAHTPQEKLTLDRYKSAVSLLENRQAILSKTQQQMQQLESIGRTGSAEYNKLKSAEMTLSRKVDEAQHKVQQLENGASIKELKEKAESNNTLANVNQRGIINDTSYKYGAYTDKNDPYQEKRDAAAKAYYEQVRNRKREYEIAAVAKNSGFSETDIDIVFAHIFELEHRFADGEVHRFDSDYYIQQSWMRLRSGRGVQKHDITLLNHELMEANIMGKGLDVAYEDAHREAEKLYNYRDDLHKYLKDRERKEK